MLKSLTSVFSFSGRVSRTQFQNYLALFVVAGFFLMGVTFITTFADDPNSINTMEPKRILVNSLIFLSFIVAVPGVVKRYHDMNRSGWWSAIALIPTLGIIWVIIECTFKKGTIGPNRFGDDPAVKH